MRVPTTRSLPFSWQPVIGYGSKRRPREAALDPVIEESGIPLNFLRTALQTRFLVAVAPKDCMYVFHR